MTRNEVAAVLAMFAAAYPGATVNEQTAKVWAEFLAEVVPEDALAAAKSLVSTCKFFPSIAEFREATRAARRVRTGNANGIESGRELEPSAEDRRQLSPEEVRALIAETKRMIAEKRAKVVAVEGLRTLGDGLEEQF